MSAYKTARILAASIIVLSAGAMSIGSASAFDVVNWNWYKNKYQTEHINVDIDVDIDSTGLVELEKLQIFFGNLSATASTSWVINDQHDAGGSWRDVYTCFCYGKVWVPYALDALTELPSVKTAASAFGNLQVITSDVPVFLHDGQFVANTGGDGYRAYHEFAELLGYSGYGIGNLHTDLAKAFTYGAAFGVLTPASITASAYTGYIVNATVDNTATAAANLTQVTLESDVAGGPVAFNAPGGFGSHTPDPLSNHVVQADITQFAYANVAATATVNGVFVDNYSNLGTIDRPLVNNAATAIGNGVIISVGPVVE